MPSPVAHSLAGIALGETKDNTFTTKDRFLFYTLAIFFALFPDLDFIPGYFRGNPNLYHHGISHSIGFGVMVALLFGWTFSKFLHSTWKGVLFVFLLYLSHLLLDYLTVDTRPPIGEPLFWPLWDRYIISPVLIFSDVQKTSDSGTFFRSLFVMHNLLGMVKEFFILLPFVLLPPFFKSNGRLSWRNLTKSKEETQ